MFKKLMKNIFYLITLLLFNSNVLAGTEDDCYISKAKTNDHALFGCPIKGYKTRYDYAKDMNEFMLLVPSKYHSDPNESNVYFSAATEKKGKYTLSESYKHDLNKTLSRGKTSKILKEYKINLKNNIGNCLGASILHDKKIAPFSYDVFFHCEYKNVLYIGLYSMGALNEKIGNKEISNFLLWLKQPQTIKMVTFNEK